MKRQIIKLGLIVLIPFAASAEIPSGDIAGYAKYIFSTMKVPFVNEQLNDHLLHTRLNSHWYLTNSFTAVMELRMRVFYGNSVKKLPGFKYQISSDYDKPKLDAVLWDKSNSFAYGQIDRLYIDYITHAFQFTFGRQRIAWGTSLVWNIIDLFNPMSIVDFDYEERPGTDALRIQYYTGAVSKIEIAVKPGKDKYDRTYAGLISINSGGYDFFLIAALKNNQKILGGAWAGHIRGAGFRGEWRVCDPPDKSTSIAYPVPSFLGPSFFESDKKITSVVLSFDYTFRNTLYLHTETMYNSQGKREYAGAFYLQALDVGMLSPARWSLFQECSYDLTPLLRGSIFGIFNPDDHSSIIMPSLSWSVVTNLDLSLIGYHTFGDSLTEWGDWGNVLFVRLKYSF